MTDAGRQGSLARRALRLELGLAGPVARELPGYPTAARSPLQRPLQRGALHRPEIVALIERCSPLIDRVEQRALEPVA